MEVRGTERLGPAWSALSSRLSQLSCCCAASAAVAALPPVHGCSWVLLRDHDLTTGQLAAVLCTPTRSLPAGWQAHG